MTFLELYLLFSICCFLIFHVSWQLSNKFNKDSPRYYTPMESFVVQLGIAICPIINLVGLCAVADLWYDRIFDIG